MRDRSFGVTILAFGSVMVALYCQFAAVALILTGAVFSPSGSTHASLAIINGAMFFGLVIASYFLAYGLWTRKHWSWAGALALFAGFVGANVLLSALSATPVNTLLPAIGAGLGIWYLNRPATKAELLGTAVPVAVRVRANEGMEMAEPVH